MYQLFIITVQQSSFYFFPEEKGKKLKNIKNKTHSENRFFPCVMFFFQDFVIKMKVTRGWSIKRSPVISETLLEPKGKAILIGDIDDFCEYVNAFFGILSECKESAVLQDQVVLNRAVSTAVRR